MSKWPADQTNPCPRGPITDTSRRVALLLGTVTVPRAVLARALAKMRREYVRFAQLQGSDPGPEYESWAEVEALAEYMEVRP